MNIFQWVLLPALGLIVVLEFARYVHDRQLRRLVRTGVWSLAVILIAAPDLATSLARGVGIGRGTDFVFYLFMLVTLVFLFHLYSQNLRLQQDIASLARRDALATVHRGNSFSATVSGDATDQMASLTGTNAGGQTSEE